MMSILMRTLLAAAALLAALPAQAIQLADGRMLLCRISGDQVDGEGLNVERLDNGGTLYLRWDHLSSASAWALKRKYALVGESDDEVLTRAEEVVYMVQGAKQTVIGRITDRDANFLFVEAKGIKYKVPAADLVGSPRTIDVPVAQVYTKDEYYQQLLATQPPGGEADKHVLLAETLVKVGDYEHAQTHLEEAKKLGNSRDPQKLEAALVRLQRFKEAAKELKLLADIEAARRRGAAGSLVEFEKGVLMIAQFEKDFPQTKLKAEFDLEKKKFADARAKYLSSTVAEAWRRAIQTVAEKKVAEVGFTLQAAREYAENKMTDDIVARIAPPLRLQPDEVKQLWSERAKYPIGKRAEQFAYSVGSWVLGEKAILKDTQTGKEADKQNKTAPAADPNQMQQFAKLLRQALERRAQGAGAGQEEEMTEEGWWTQATRSDKRLWLSAYYAEFGGQLVVTFATVSPCISCYGEGSTPDMTPDGKPTRTKCFLCQQTKWLRSFKAY